ncbi:MAG: hypothetical protein HOP08_12885 [Cyclobacteriaceae bacterium]|nr:hypothetical protein [Cyclobacteriaceae bacterium]
MVRVLRWTLYFIIFLVSLVVIGYGAAQYFRPSILRTINEELKESVNGDVKIGWLDFTIFEQFPNFSITLGKIYVRGPHFDKYHKDFLTADKIYIHVNPIRLFQGAISLKSISIRNGTVFIFTDTKGYTNMDVLKKQKKDSVESTGPKPALELEDIFFEDTRVTYVDSLKNKSIDITLIKTFLNIASSDSLQRISLRGKMGFGGLVLNAAKGGYLTKKATDADLNLEFRPSKKELTILPSELKFKNSTVALSGRFDFSKRGGFTLNIDSKDLNYSEGLSLITKALREKLEKFQFDGPIDLNVKLQGSLGPGAEPKVDIAFTSRGNHFVTGKLDAKDLSFKGSFTNHIDSTKEIDDHNSRIVLDTVSTRIEEVGVEANLVITDLTDPKLKLISKSHINLTDINHETDTASLKLLGGIFDADINYNGKLNEYLDGPKTVYRGKLKGTVRIKDGSLVMRQQEKKFDRINAQFRFTEERMDLDEIDFRINGNPVMIKGNVIGFIPFFFVPEEKGSINLSITSPRIDLASLKTSKSNEKVSPKAAARGKKKISDLLDILNSKVEFILDVKVNEIVNGSFHASKFSGKVNFMNNHLIANPVSMRLADGEVDLSLKVFALDKKINPVTLRAEVKNADIQKFFSSFDNFSQKTIQSKNLSGKVFTKLNLTAKIDDKFNILMPSLSGTVDFKLREGELKDFEPLEKMSNFLFKKRDFSDVQFAEIKGQFSLSGQYLDVSRMEIESSVLSLFLEGRYSLGDSTDLTIQVPLSNLKKRNKDYKPENVGVDAKVGPSVFLRAHQNKEGKMVIVYNLFKKFKKK